MPPKKADQTAADPMVALEFNGHTFQIPRDQEKWPTRAIIAATRRQYDAVVEKVLGPAQWDLLMDVAAPSYEEFMEFLKMFAETVEQECS